MNWEAVGSIGELVGAIGVIASLLYLSVQIRHSTKASRLATSHALATATRQWTDPMQADADLARIFQIGVEDPGHLDESEKARFIFICFSFFRMFEDIHFQFENGALDIELWEGYKRHYGAYFLSPGLQYYWSERREIFRPAFREFLESHASQPFVRLDAMATGEK